MLLQWQHRFAIVATVGAAGSEVVPGALEYTTLAATTTIGAFAGAKFIAPGLEMIADAIKVINNSLDNGNVEDTQENYRILGTIIGGIYAFTTTAVSYVAAIGAETLLDKF